MSDRYSSFKAASEQAKVLAEQCRSVAVRRDGDKWVVITEPAKSGESANADHTGLWVCRFPITGSIVVIDKNIKVPGVKNLYGYSVSRELVRQFDQNTINLAEEVFGKLADGAVAKYVKWKGESYDVFLESEQGRIAATKQQVIEKHRRYLEKIGKPYSGVDSCTSKSHRATHCYACKRSLDSEFHIECMECGWLICECGACGCGFET